MAHMHPLHFANPPYAPPVLRAPSPSSSIGTEYGPDTTAYSDRDLTQEEFEAKCETKMRLYFPREEEIRANADPLLPHPKSAAEQKALLDNVMSNLRASVRQLEEDELFEQSMLRGTQITQEQQPSSHDIDTIMRSMMITAPYKTGSPVGATSTTLGSRSTTIAPGYTTETATDASSGTAGKGITRNKGKSRKA